MPDQDIKRDPEIKRDPDAMDADQRALQDKHNEQSQQPEQSPPSSPPRKFTQEELSAETWHQALDNAEYLNVTGQFDTSVQRDAASYSRRSWTDAHFEYEEVRCGWTRLKMRAAATDPETRNRWVGSYVGKDPPIQLVPTVESELAGDARLEWYNPSWDSWEARRWTLPDELVQIGRFARGHGCINVYKVTVMSSITRKRALRDWNPESPAIE
ncbi:hypothetical protein BDY21DRAFT_375177 [Lineolata rhizophorae]|uniref:Uncharacterized protein n=1 Tax=Lineolata rhizophorae TaxID=578093 RepID=A0A6A6NMQ6_9PEZI|nr:hypothetical protein BDY21DRAFT_375177 [Lineolata rhizophorae]